MWKVGGATGGRDGVDPEEGRYNRHIGKRRESVQDMAHHLQGTFDVEIYRYA